MPTRKEKNQKMIPKHFRKRQRRLVEIGTKPCVIDVYHISRIVEAINDASTKIKAAVDLKPNLKNLLGTKNTFPECGIHAGCSD